ncbi:MAG: HAD-IC family P-type ATPase, partial [Deltaproteobacteria bacterium]|nr:HAD-IC family P-type ATPase [Deltaproteobacteria bacterium]
MAASPPSDWHSKSLEQALASLGSSQEGLTQVEAERRVGEYGPNAFSSARPPSAWRMLGRQLNDPIIYLLLAATVLAAGLGKITDAIVVFAAIALNTLIGFVQEIRANQAIGAISRMVPNHATALRDGERRTLLAEALVPGDVILLSAGDRVPADARLLSVHGARADESALTGESLPVDKQPRPVPAGSVLGDRSDMVYGGTTLTTGAARGVVVATGSSTELGRISALLEQAQELQTPLTRTLARVGRLLTYGVVGLSAVLFAVGLWRGHSLVDALMVTVTLAVAAIPEGLPAIITIALAIGVQRMAARRAIVRRLPSVETLGSTTVICTDKTGTLTRNEMTVRALWTPGGGRFQVTGVGYSLSGRLLAGGDDGSPGIGEAPLDVVALLRAGALCNDASIRPDGDGVSATGDPTEVALLVAAEKLGVRLRQWQGLWPRQDVVPFDSERQMMATLHRDPAGGHLLLLKGAPEAVLPLCGASRPEDVEEGLAEAQRLARQGMRVLAMA